VSSMLQLQLKLTENKKKVRFTVPYTGGKGIRGVLHNLILLFWKWIEDGYENIC
jgi:hypothetical protein